MLQGLDYVVIGVATCFQRNEDGRLSELQIVEPIPAADLDCLRHENRPTSYSLIYATTYGEIIHDDQPYLPTDVIPVGTVAGENFVQRVQAAARTYLAKPEFKHIPLHEHCTPEAGVFRLQYTPEPKRILGANYTPSDADNVKQHAYTHQAL